MPAHLIDRASLSAPASAWLPAPTKTLVSPRQVRSAGALLPGRPALGEAHKLAEAPAGPEPPDCPQRGRSVRTAVWPGPEPAIQFKYPSQWTSPNWSPRTGTTQGTSLLAPKLGSSSQDLHQWPPTLRSHPRAVQRQAPGLAASCSTLARGTAVEAWPTGDRLSQGMAAARQTAFRTLESGAATHGANPSLFRRATISQEP